MRTSPVLRPPLRRVGVAIAALFLSLLSCGREVTGPADGVRIATGLSFVAEFPRPLAELQQGASSLIPFSSVRIFFRRSDNSIALDKTYPFGANTDTLPLALNIALSPNAPAEGEPLSLFLRYINADGDTVFSGGPVQVLAVARRRGDPFPPPAQVPLEYTGPGAEATTIELTPDTLAIVAGDGFSFSTIVRDGQGALVSGAPVIFTSLDPTKITLLGQDAPEGSALATRGIARVRAVLVATGAADTAVVQIAPQPASLQRLGLTALAGQTNSVLADSVVVRLLATDGGPIADAAVNVVIEGGGGVNDTTLITDANGRAAVQWTLGTAVGVAAQRLRFGSTGVAELIVTATATAPALPASKLFINQQATGSRLSLETIAPELIVQARNANDEVVTNFAGSVSVAVASGPPGGTVQGVTTVNAVNGFATFAAIKADLVGTYQFVVTADGLTPDTTTAITITAGAAKNIALISGGGQTAFVGAQLPTPISVRVTDEATNPIANTPVTFAVTAGGGALLGAATQTDSTGLATLGAWTLGATAGTQTITATVSGVAPFQINATAQPLVPVIELKVIGSNVVGFQRNGDLAVRLLQPAPVGGLTVSVISDSAQYLTIGEPGNVTFAAGDTLATIGVFGANTGVAVVRATGSGYTPDTLAVPVSLNLISLPTTLNVPLDGTVSLPVQISAPAPAGGIVVKLVTSAPGTVGLVTDSVVIAAGTQVANATLQGVSLGGATITASNANYSPDATNATVTAGVDIFNASLSLNASFGTTMTVRLVSGAVPVAAPVGGINITLEAANPACVNVQNSAFIDAGFTNVVLPVTAAAGGTFPCTSIVRAIGPAGFTTDSVTANVAAAPAIVAPVSAFLGSGLQRGFTLSLGATNHGGTAVRIESTDPSRILISPNVSTLGSAFIDVPINISGNTANFVVQSLEGIVSDTVLVRLTAPGFVSDSFPVFRYQSAYEIVSLLTTMTTAAIDEPFTVRVGSVAAPTNDVLSNIDEIRAGGVPRVFSIVNDSLSVVNLVTTATVGDSVTITIPVGASQSGTTVATGGVAVRPQSAGQARIRAVEPSMRAITTAARSLTVTQANISSVEAISGNFGLGRGLQRQLSIGLSDAPPSGSVLLTIKPSRPGFVLLAPDNGTLGSADSLVLTVTTNADFVTVQALEGAPLDTLSLLLSAPGFGSFTAPVTILEPVLQIASTLNGTGTTASADDEFFMQIGSPAGAAGTSIRILDAARAGGPGITVSVISDSSAVGTLVTTARTADSVTVRFEPEASQTSGSISGGGVALRYLGPGVTTVRARGDLTRELSGATATVTVTQPSISGLTGFGLGAGLQRGGTLTLNAPAPAGGLPVTLSTDTPGRFLLAPNATTVGTESVVITVPAGATSATYVVQALEVAPDTVILTASSPGWTSRTANLFVWVPVVDLISFTSSFTTLTGEDLFNVRVGTSNSANGTFVSSIDERRFGATPLVATVVSSNGLVGRLVTLATVADTVTTQIAAGLSNSPGNTASGGVAFRPLTSGTTVVSATIPGFTQAPSAAGSTVTVTTPAITVGTITSIGAGLQVGASVTLNASQHGGINVIVKSSNPAIAKVARFATDAATDSIIVPLGNGLANFTYIVAGQDGVTGSVSILASAPGFTDGSGVANVVTPAIEIQSLATAATAGGADDPFLARVGIPNGTLTSVGTVQNVRAGSPGITVTFTSSNPTVGALVTSAATGSPVTAVIPGGSATTPNLVSSGGVALRPATAGSTLIQPAATGFTRMATTGSVTVTVNP